MDDICSSIVYTLSRIYFFLVTFIFRLVNFFKIRNSIPITNDPLLLISATDAVRKIARREITSQQLVNAYIHRIEQVNELINAAVVKLFVEAIKKAEEIDKSIANMDDYQVEELTKSKPLLGVPYTVKDALEVNGQVITCGIYDQKGVKSTSTAEVIKRMEAAGAILIAITNVPEVCYWMETSNGIYGRTKNPYDTRRSVGGSSGGEGALISAAGSVIGIGSDIGGSIRIPSFMNGIFGMANTPGVIPLDGHVPMPKGYQTKMLRHGPMCRYVEDIPLLVKVMGGDKVSDLRLSEEVDLRKIRVYYMEGIQNTPTVQSLSADMKSALLEVVEQFKSKFDVEAIRIDFPLVTNAVEMHSFSMDVEDKPKIAEYLLSLKADKGKLNWFAEVPKLLVGKSHHTLASVFIAMLESMNRTPENEKRRILRLRDTLIRQVTETLGDNGILLFPSWPHTTPFHHQSIFSLFNVAYTGLFSALALPVIQCPMGLDSDGLPLGVQVVGSPNSDRLLIAVAKEISEAFGGWTAAWSQ